ncbi:MAG: hypothetical protein ACYCV4_18680 [Dermatophilaceae bacterium]
MLDQVLTIRTRHAQAIPNAFAVSEAIAVEELDRLDQVLLAEPFIEHADDLVGTPCVPDPPGVIAQKSISGWMSSRTRLWSFAATAPANCAPRLWPMRPAVGRQGRYGQILI